jgi:hypothetical protein
MLREQMRTRRGKSGGLRDAAAIVEEVNCIFYSYIMVVSMNLYVLLLLIFFFLIVSVV